MAERVTFCLLMSHVKILKAMLMFYGWVHVLLFDSQNKRKAKHIASLLLILSNTSDVVRDVIEKNFK